MEELKYYKSKRHKNRDRFASIITIGFSGLMIYSAIQKELDWIIIFFGILFIIGLHHFINSFRNNATLVLNNEGIYSKNNGSGLIEWQFIESFNNNDSGRLFFLVVEINDIDEALKNKNFLTKMLMKSNIKRLGSPIVFPSMQFQKPLEEVVEEMNEFRNNLKFKD